MPGGPSSSLTWLVRHLTEYDLKLSKGAIVLGGTALGLFRVKPGDKITVNIDGQQTVHCAVNFD